MNWSHHLSRLATASILGFLLMSSTGCGFIFSHAPPEGYEQMDYFSCTESNAGPIIDVVWGSLGVINAILVAADPDYYRDEGYEPGGLIAVSLSWGMVSGAAAVVGFNKSKKCRAAKLELAQRQARGRMERTDLAAGDVVVQAVVIAPATDTLLVGERVQLMATAHNSSGASIPNKVFTWSSSNDAIASVTNAGLVTAHANGTVVVAANTDNVVGTARIVVKAPEL
jgi:hypothetical protein